MYVIATLHLVIESTLSICNLRFKNTVLNLFPKIKVGLTKKKERVSNIQIMVIIKI